MVPVKQQFVNLTLQQWFHVRWAQQFNTVLANTKRVHHTPHDSSAVNQPGLPKDNLVSSSLFTLF